jgi:hypothetical protein
MPASLHQESGNLYRLQISGVLRRRDLDEVRDIAAHAITRAGAIKLLCIMERFAGWERTNETDDMKFYLKFGKQIERIAIVADEKWRDQSLMFAGAGVRNAPVEFFAPGQKDAARKWILTEDSVAQRHP